jgi:hypothetical protein
MKPIIQIITPPSTTTTTTSEELPFDISNNKDGLCSKFLEALHFDNVVGEFFAAVSL